MLVIVVCIICRHGVAARTTTLCGACCLVSSHHLAGEQARNESFFFEEPLADYMRIVRAVRGAIANRVEMRCVRVAGGGDACLAHGAAGVRRDFRSP